MGLIEKGAAFIYDVKDRDGTHTCRIDITSIERSLVVEMRWNKDRTTTPITFSQKALQSARSWALCAAKSVSFPHGRRKSGQTFTADGDLPPCMLSREMLEELRQGQTQVFVGSSTAVPGSGLRPLLTQKNGTTSVPRGDGKATLSSLSAKGEKVSLVVADDPEAPLLLELKNIHEGYHFKLKEIVASSATKTAAVAAGATRRFEQVIKLGTRYSEVLLEGTRLSIRNGMLGEKMKQPPRVEETKTPASAKRKANDYMNTLLSAGFKEVQMR